MNYVIDSLLCYIQAVRDIYTHDKIIKNVVGFYSNQRILKSKDILFTTAKTKMVKRKACDSHPNPADADVMDILELLEKVDASEKENFPSYVSVGIDAMPSSDFDVISGVLCSLRDEIYSLRQEVSDVRNERERDVKILEQSDSIMADLSEIKVLCRDNKMSNLKPDQSVASNTPVPSSLNNVPVPSTLKVHRSQGEASGSHLPPASSFRDVLLRSPVSKTAPENSFNSERKHDESRRLGREFRSNSNSKISFNRKKFNGMKGTRILTNDSNIKLSVSKPMHHIYIGGCSTEVKTDSLVKYCEGQDVDVRECVELNSKNNFSKSFRITVESCVSEAVMREDFWPQGIIFRKFFFPRNKQ